MKSNHIIIALIAVAILFACQQKQSQKDTVSKQECEVADTLELRTFVNQVYDDILPRYNDGKGCMDYAFKNYASDALLKVLDDADSIAKKYGVDILGWDCDPWILAQDWGQPKAIILKTNRQSASRGYVDVLIKDGDDVRNDRKIRLLLIKENETWKVNDFIGTESADYAPTFTEVLKEEMHDAENTKAPVPSIFDELANSMVLVERDSGNYYICKYEVTQKLWSKVMGDNPSDMQGDELPVEQVNWNDCQRFISKLNKLTGKAYRLPTEAEWEYACRGGKHSKGYAFSGSNSIDEVAWYDGNSKERSHPVGQKKPNELGLYDMSGNVWEWCEDMHDGTGMCRGGSWIHNARNCDPSLPNETPQAFSISCLGLRLAM